MEQRKLGALQVPAVGLGCMVMPAFYTPGSIEDSIATLHRAAEIGVTLIDSSDAYGKGKNEELIGQALKGRRDRYILATKFGQIRHPDGTGSVNGRPEYVQQACEASLKRLGVDHIDLYYQHRVDPETPIEETVGAMARLVEQGKVRHLGLSEASAATLRRAHATHPIAALQSEFSLWSRDLEHEQIPLCAKLGIGFVAYSPMGRGILGGGIAGVTDLAEGDRRRTHPRYLPEAMDANLKLLQPLRDMAAGKGCSVGQLALAWVLGAAKHIVPIPGTRRIAHLEENARVPEIGLTAEEWSTLDRTYPLGVAEGPRNNAGSMKRMNI